MKKKIFCLLICLILVLTQLIACQNDEEKNVSNEDTSKSINMTDIVLFENNSSSYKVVIPNDADEWEKFAGDEFQYFFEKSTGFKLDIISDSGLSLNENDKYFSIGRTTIFEESGITASYDELGRDGYKIVRKGNTLILVGGEGYGTIYSVYGFFRREVDYRPYAPDEIYVKRVSKLNLLDFNLTDIPDIADRCGSCYATFQDKVFCTRSRTFKGAGTLLFGSDNIYGGKWAHTFHQYLPKDKYEAAHPEWYSGSGGNQLCLTNQELRDEMAIQVIEDIKAHPNSEYFFVTQRDNSSWCSCDACVAECNVYGLGGNLMRFINNVAEKIEKWQNENCPERHISVVTFAYWQAQNPPVKKDDNGNYVPIDETVVARDNVNILIAPIASDLRLPIYDERTNEVGKKLYEGWSVISKNISTWFYSNYFDMQLEYYDNFDAILANYRYFADMNLTYLFDESSGSIKGAQAFQNMLSYIHSELMWDASLNIYDLIYDFMKHYYKEAYEPMKNYFDLITNFVAERKNEFSEIDNTFYGTNIWHASRSENNTVKKKEFWSKQILEKMIGYFDEAYEIINNLYSGVEKDILLDRIKLESLTPRLYLTQLYTGSYNVDEYLQMVDDFEEDAMHFGISCIYRNGNLATEMEQLREKVR